MRNPAMLPLVLVLLCSGCGGEDGGTTPVDPTRPQDVVDAYLAAAKAQDGAAMRALGPEGWDGGAWTRDIVREELELTSTQVLGEETDDATVHIRVKVGIRTPSGEEDGDVMRFSLVRQGERYVITDVR